MTSIAAAATEPTAALNLSAEKVETSDRARRIHDAVEGALVDILLLDTQEHVYLAESAARELVAGHPVHAQDLVVSLRAFVREALDLDPIPAGLAIPMQGSARPGGTKDKDKGGDAKSGGGSGMGMGGGMAFDGSHAHEDDVEAHHT